MNFWIILLYTLIATINVSFVLGLIGYPLYKYKFINLKIYDTESRKKDFSINDVVGIFAFLVGIELIVNIMCALFGDMILDNFMFYLFNIIGFSAMFIYLIYLLFFSFRGKYAFKYIKIEKLKKKIKEIDETFNNKEAVILLNKSLDKLNKELEALLLKETIKDAKNIELSFKKDIIRKELDELQALQELNQSR